MFRCTDDIIMITESAQDVHENLVMIENKWNKYNMNLNKNKTEIIVTGNNTPKLDVQ